MAAAAVPAAANLAQYLPAIISAIGSGVGGIFGGQETPNQESQRQLIDQLMASLGGNGPFSDLFNMDEDMFQKSYVDPAKSRFQNQIAPQIQQSFIAGGQQGGTGLQDTLTRAGVDLDQMLNQQYGQFKQQGQSNQMDIISKILGAGSGTQGPQSGFDKFTQGVGGYLTSSSFPKSIEQMLDRRPQLNNKQNQNRSGYINE